MVVGPGVVLVGDPPLGPLVAVVAAGRVERLVFDPRTPVAGGGRHEAGCPPVAASDRAVVEGLRQGLARWFATGDGCFDVPLDLGRVGPFRAAVYEALRTVPAGERITYGQLAVQAGYPGAARAVGRAMATNPWPLVVPCHRVVPASGGLGNYAGGAGRKAWMLAVEAAGGAAQAGP